MAATQLYRVEKKIHPIEAHRPTLSKQELESVLDCLINDRLGAGAMVQRFERAFSSSFDYKHVLAVNSLASAYHLAFVALEIQPGDRILMSALAPVQAYDAARYVGAEPVPVDLERSALHPSLAKIEKLLEEDETLREKPPAFVVIDHAFGSPSPLTAEWFRKRDIRIVEDFTGLVGSDREGEFYGKMGQVSVCGLSEYDLLTTGNGAMVVTAETRLAGKLQALRYGGKRQENSVAYDYCIEDFRAALGLEQLARLGSMLERRKKIGRKYLETIQSMPHEAYFCQTGVDAYLRFPVVINKSHEQIQRYFKSLQIGVTRVTDTPLHHLLGLAKLQFPNAERMYQRAVCIPIYPALTANNVERIAASLRGLV